MTNNTDNAGANKTNAYETWDKQRGAIHTHIGGWEIGVSVTTYGHSLIDELVGKKSYFEILILSITGTLPEPRLAKWVEALYSCMSFPDPRIWCNQIGTLAGTARASAVSGITAGIQASDSRMYGPGTLSDVYNFLSFAMEHRLKGATVEGIISSKSRHSGSQPVIPSFSRPLASGDERVIALNTLTEELGFKWEPYMVLVRDIELYMLRKYNKSMSLPMFVVGFLRDQHWSLEQIQQVLSIMVTAGVAACYSEALEKPAETFLPLRCTDIDYCGAGPRTVPI
ncbi:MAG: hypothetical protein COB30_010690 [Ectothiorhodospiraceae bacterium]|nr:hypothetical protein [Ectothiorhodospiraceae bacterium]